MFTKYPNNYRFYPVFVPYSPFLKQKSPAFAGDFYCAFYLNSSFDLTASHAVSTYINGLMSAVYNSLNLSDVRLPHSAGLSVRVRNIVTKGNCLLAKFTLCHLFYPPLKIKFTVRTALTDKRRVNLCIRIIVTIIAQQFQKCNSIFKIFYFFFFADFFLFASLRARTSGVSSSSISSSL